MTTNSGALKKLKIIGYIGRVLAALTAVFYIIYTPFSILQMVRGDQPSHMGCNWVTEKWYDKPVPPMQEFGLSDHDAVCETCLPKRKNKNRVTPPICFESLPVAGSSLNVIFDRYLFPITATILLYLVFRSFSRGEIFGRCSANCVVWLGIMIALLAFDYEFYRTATERIEDGSTIQTTGFVVSTIWNVGLVILGLIFSAFGLAMRYGSQIEEERRLTV